MLALLPVTYGIFNTSTYYNPTFLPLPLTGLEIAS